MASKHTGRGRGRKFVPIQKPNGTIHPRVQAVGPEHFAVISVDCAKRRSKWMVADFYGKVLSPPKEVCHTRGDFDAAILSIRETCQRFDIRDCVVGVERAGNYHQPARRAFLQANFDVRIVHSFTTKQFRQPANPGDKTDETDLAAIHRAVVNGFGLIERPLDPLARELRLLVRHRRDLVDKATLLCNQLREHLGLAMPGYCECFDPLWTLDFPLFVARHSGSADQLLALGADGLKALLKKAGIQYHAPSVDKALAWARTAPPADPDAKSLHRVWTFLEDDRQAKNQEIQRLERDILALLVQTRYVRLLAIPGVALVTAAEFAGEMGPIEHYSNAKAVTGRAGLYPSRYQSDAVDRANGPLVRCRNRSLRAAIMLVADCLLKSNRHFRSLAEVWKAKGKDPVGNHVRVAGRFCRIAYAVVAGEAPFAHPAIKDRDYVLAKLLILHRQLGAPADATLANLQAACNQVPQAEHAAEADALKRLLPCGRSGRGRQPRLLGDVIPALLAKLLGKVVECPPSGERPSSEPKRDLGTNNVFRPLGANPG